MTPDSPIAADVSHVIRQTKNLWSNLREASIFVTGGTGLFGRWLLECIVEANYVYNLDLNVLVLTRNSRDFIRKARMFSDCQMVRFYHGDVRDFTFPNEKFTHVIHAAATNATSTFNNEDPLVKFDIVLDGTKRMLDFAARSEVEKFLFISSGSVYGQLPASISNVPEYYVGAPSTVDMAAASEQGKRAAEFLAAYYAGKYGFDMTIARCFSFAGPYLPLNIHYALGNFINDALFSDEITVKGDGSPIRSYLYMGDLIVWLLTLLVKGQSNGIYNVGSDMPISMRDLAYLVRDTLSQNKDVRVIGQSGIGGNSRNVYVPDIQRARNELALDVWTPLEQAIRRTAEVAAQELGEQPKTWLNNKSFNDSAINLVN